MCARGAAKHDEGAVAKHDEGAVANTLGGGSGCGCGVGGGGGAKWGSGCWVR